MEFLEKPKFIQKVSGIIYTGITTIVGLITALFPKSLTTKVFNIPVIWYIIFLTIIILFVIYAFIYIYKVNKFYKYHEKIVINNKALTNLLTEKKQEIQNLKSTVRESYRTIQSLGNNIQQGITDISFEEKKYLKNIYEIFKIDTKHFYNMEGEIKYE